MSFYLTNKNTVVGPGTVVTYMISGFYLKFGTNLEMNRSVIMMATTHLKMEVKQISQTCFFLSNVLHRASNAQG
jgi:hypothetical protein